MANTSSIRREAIAKSPDFATMLAKWLDHHRLTPQQAAPLLSVGHVTVYSWLKGDYQPSNTRIPALARTLKVSESDVRRAIERSRNGRGER